MKNPPSPFRLHFGFALLSLSLAGCVVTSGPVGEDVGLGGVGVVDEGLGVDVGPAWGGGTYVDENNYYGGGHHHGGHGRR